VKTGRRVFKGLKKGAPARGKKNGVQKKKKRSEVGNDEPSRREKKGKSVTGKASKGREAVPYSGGEKKLKRRKKIGEGREGEAGDTYSWWTFRGALDKKFKIMDTHS